MPKRHPKGSATLTIRIRPELKKRLEQAADGAHQTVTDYTCRAIEQRMKGTCRACGREGVLRILIEPSLLAATLAAAVPSKPSTKKKSLKRRRPKPYRPPATIRTF